MFINNLRNFENNPKNLKNPKYKKKLQKSQENPKKRRSKIDFFFPPDKNAILLLLPIEKISQVQLVSESRGGSTCVTNEG